MRTCMRSWRSGGSSRYLEEAKQVFTGDDAVRRIWKRPTVWPEQGGKIVHPQPAAAVRTSLWT